MPNYSDAELDNAWNSFQSQPAAPTSQVPSDAELDQVWNSYQGQQPQAAQQNASDAMNGYYANALQGSAFGTDIGTKIGAIPIALGQAIKAMHAGGDFTDTFSNVYNQYTANQIGQREQYAKENPKNAIAAQAMGAMAPLAAASIAGAPVALLGGISAETAANAPAALAPARWLLAGPTVGVGKAALANRLAWNAAQGAIPGAINAPEGEGIMGATKGAALGAALGAPFEMTQGLSRFYGGRSQAAKEEALGIRAALKAREQPRGAFVTASGEVVPTSELGTIEEAVTRENPFNKAINIVEQDGRLKSNAPAALEAELAGRKAIAGHELGNLIRTTDELVSTAADNLGVKSPKFRPDWSYAEDFIKSGKGTSGIRDTLQNQLDKFKNEWEKSPKGFADLVSEKRTITTSANWQASAEEQARASLARAVYRGYQESAEKAFTDITKAAGRPDLAGQFKDLNKKLWAYNLLQKPIADRAGKNADVALGFLPKTLRGIAGMGILTGGAVPLAGASGLAVPLAYQVARNQLPMTFSRGYRGLSNALNEVSQLAPELARGGAAVYSSANNPANPQSPNTQYGQGSSSGAVTMANSDSAQQMPNDVQQMVPSVISSTSGSNSTPDPRQEAISKLVNAMISTESAGNPKAVSSAGAQGLMQIMPQHYARLGITDPTDPEQSVQGGLTILGEEYQRYGDLALALAAYNAGSPKVNAAIKKAGSTDFEKVKKFLPAETQKYVPSIMRKLG
jgi:hypothetical protein